MEFLFPILGIIISCIIIWRVSNHFETASEYLGRNLSEGVRGATINAIGSSIPELFTALFFLLLLNKKEGFSGSVGATAGSAIFNGIIIPAVVVLIVYFTHKTAKVIVSRKVILRDGIALILCNIVLMLILTSQKLEWFHGLILMSLYLIYLTFMLVSMKKKPSFSTKDDHDYFDELNRTKPFWKICIHLDLKTLIVNNNSLNTRNSWFLLLAATLVIGVASAILVYSCEKLGLALNIPIYFVAVILASAATSIPDTILSIRDAQKGNYDDAVSNALGSNIFDICFALGLPLFLATLCFGPIELSGATKSNVQDLMILLLFITILSFFTYLTWRNITWVQSMFLLLLYFFFVSFILGRALGFNWTKECSEIFRQIYWQLQISLP